MTRKSTAKTPAKANAGKFKPRISRRLRTALEQMVWHGAPRSEAAQRADMTDSALYKALRRPHVLRELNQEFERLRTAEASRAFFRQVQLGEHANSEDVKERANRFIAGCGGIAPVQKVAVKARHTHSFEGIGIAEPGTVDWPPDEAEDAETVDAEAVDVTEDDA